MCPDSCYIFPDMVIGTIKENSLTNEKQEAVTSTNQTLMKRLFVTNGQSRKSDRNLSPVYTSKDEKFAEYYLLGTLLSMLCVIVCKVLIFI